ncbi:hypothetical protein [Streptomyces sp. NPDC001678]|uniref:hypothetical protein n=1 Tax=Streptomyces sp. NPDC001678 TaxID=3364599 RepID=UPI0036BCAFC9
MAEQAEAHWFGPGQLALFTRLRSEHASLRAALECCLGEADPRGLRLRMAGALWIYWLACGLQQEGRLWLDRALAHDDTPGPRRATALWANGYLAALQGDTPLALKMFEECRDLARRLGDRAMPAHTVYASGLARLNGQDLATAVALLAEGVRLERALLSGATPHANIAEGLLGLAACLSREGDSAIGILQRSRPPPRLTASDCPTRRSRTGWSSRHAPSKAPSATPGQTRFTSRVQVAS